MNSIVEIQNIKHSYKTREALRDVSFSVERGEIFGLLGPNGSGKTTLFRILSTSLIPTHGKVSIDENRIPEDYSAIRKKIGVVFQSPSLDPKLTVYENLMHQAHLYGISGQSLKNRIAEMLGKLGLEDRAKDLVSTLSGGLKRRVELAKGLIHDPVLLILDEPSTGLDPGARIDLWTYLKNLRDQKGVSVLVTTHLMEEAEHCDRIAILNEGKLVSLGTPDELKRKIGGDVVIVRTNQNEILAAKIKAKFNVEVRITDQGVQIEHEKGHEFVTRLVEAFPGEIESVTYRKPSLEDVFVHETGHQFWTELQDRI
jgi:ABC-2 type transport system ATP-binding protein